MSTQPHRSDRRAFLKNTSLALAGTALLPGQLIDLNEAKKTYLGVQLYSVRDEMKKDPLGTLKQVAAMGYKYVEHAGYRDRKFYGYAPKEFKKILSDLGMKMYSGHTMLGKDHWDATKKDFTAVWKWTVEDAAIVGQKYVVSPWMDEIYRKTYDDLVAYMDVFNQCGELCKRSGMKYGYHNHHFEFNTKFNGQTIYDIILERTDPKVVTQQLDTGNLYNGGAIARDVLSKHPGRFELFHVKDEIEAPAGSHDKYESCVLGQGIVGIQDMVKNGKAMGGTRYFVIEQESYQGRTPLDCIRDDYNAMRKWGF
jgi:sugar phosphate isomerase/epimerase